MKETKNRYGIPEGKKRFSLTLTEENIARLKEVADEFKMTPSALISHLIENDLASIIVECLIIR